MILHFTGWNYNIFCTVVFTFPFWRTLWLFLWHDNCSWLHLCSLEFSLRQHKKNISKTILFMIGSTSTSSLIINTSKHSRSWCLCYLALRYFLRVSIIRRISDISKELDLAVHTLASFPEMNNRYVQGFVSFISELPFFGEAMFNER